jgi:hypothetical protein
MPSEQDLLRNIGQEVSRIAKGATGRIVNAVEADDGVIAAAVYFVRRNKVVFKYPTDELVDLLEELWLSMKTPDPSRHWCEMIFLVEGGRFTVELFYPGDLAGEPPDVKQRNFVRQYFGVDDWDQSDPEPDPIDDR